ncbi:MAG TPA: ABC transporter substrate-binding protein [Bradyrhizobium sp.]|jgi:iron complex transport system substrate-binding protein|uniref:ABC transporter substrate-binding protein n=1 Tax=Bradyrhizobium sp. TaxID=376 RepID=UPI002B48EA7B|nr:ABC transporter substrate-binding protein [Bradyrhizobium sp.]HKO73084.1 ABC transporter substrate-binding protein [Bradyrhizobium sp.]
MSGCLRFSSLSIALSVFISALGSVPAWTANSPRIASMNVCTDELLVPLADPEQIVGLSRFSRAARIDKDASRFPILSGGAEDLLVLKPDVVVASLFDRRSTRELLKANGVHVVEFPVPRNVDEVKAQIREMGEIAGHPDRAAAEIARLEAALAHARQAIGGKHYRVLQLSRRGWVDGSNSFMGSLLTATGLVNTAGELGFTSGGFASLETIVNLKPDLLVVSKANGIARDEGHAFLLHPALERFYPPDKRIVIPEALTECGSVMLAEALDVLVQQLKRINP